MVTVKVRVRYRNIGNVTIRTLNLSAGLFDGRSFSQTKSYRDVRPGDQGLIEFIFNNVPPGNYTVWAEATDELGITLKRTSRRVIIQARQQKNASIRVLGWGSSYVRVEVTNTGTTDAYFYVAGQICSYDGTQCYNFRIPRKTKTLRPGEKTEVLLVFDRNAMERVVTKRPRRLIVSVWNDYIAGKLIPPKYDEYRVIFFG